MFNIIGPNGNVCMLLLFSLIVFLTEREDRKLMLLKLIQKKVQKALSAYMIQRGWGVKVRKGRRVRLWVELTLRGCPRGGEPSMKKLQTTLKCSLRLCTY